MPNVMIIQGKVENIWDDEDFARMLRDRLGDDAERYFREHSDLDYALRDVTDEQIQNSLDEGEEIDVSPFTDEIMYTYDFGDGWQFFITGSRGYSDLIEEKAVTPIKADRAVTKALKMQRPVVLAADGDMLIEDVGNIEGYAAFIEHMRLAPDAVIEEVHKIGNLDGCVVLMHSIYDSTAKATEKIVPYLMNRGYQIVTVSELIKYKSGASPKKNKVYMSGNK